MTGKVCVRLSVVVLVVLLGLGVTFSGRSRNAAEGAKAPPVYRSPFWVVAANGKVYVSDRTAKCVVVLDAAQNREVGEIPVRGEPTGLAISRDGRRLYVSEYGAGSVAVIALDKLGNGPRITPTAVSNAAPISRVSVGLRPMGLALAERANLLFVCNSDVHSLSVVDAKTLKEVKRVPMVREPQFAAVTPDESRVVVSNGLSLGRATDPDLAADVSIVDVKSLSARHIKLSSGSTNLRGVCVSPDGRWAYVVHCLGHFNVPPTQLERGWINTNALSLIDLNNCDEVRRPYATMLLDNLSEGAADPCGIALSADGKQLWVALTGTHQVAVVDIAKLHELLEGKVPPEIGRIASPTSPNPWEEIKKSPEARELLTVDLTALYIAGAIQRVPSGGQGPHGIALAADGQKFYVANYFSGNVAVIEAGSGNTVNTIPVGTQPAPDLVRRGEMIFHDATVTFQHWHSCATCHPHKARMDGFNWDLLNDGLGNPKNNKSMLFAPRTPPMMSRRVREDPEIAIRQGFRVILFTEPTQEQVDAVLAYFNSLQPEPSPHLTRDGKLTPAAKRGKALFEGKARCAGCHPAPLYTDLKAHDIGTKSDNDSDGLYDTPTLVEVYRTGPYLHDGRAATLKEVFTLHNKNDRHGKTSQLTPQELDDLVAYLLSLS